MHLAKGFQRRRLKWEKLTGDGHQVMAKAHIAVLDITSFFFPHGEGFGATILLLIWADLRLRFFGSFCFFSIIFYLLKSVHLLVKKNVEYLYLIPDSLALVKTRGSAHWACIAHLTIEWYWSKFQREIIITLKNSNHLEWRVGLSDTILKGTHPGTIYAKFGSIWPSCFRG